MKIVYLLLALFLASGLACAVSADNLTLGGSGADKISLYNDATDLAYEGNYNESLAMLEQAIAIDSNFTLAYVSKAGILTVTGDYEGALEASDIATGLNPGQADAWVSKSSALISLGRYEEGLSAAERAAEINPQYLEAWINIGTACENLGMYQEELDASEKAIAIDPQNNLAWANKRYAQKMLDGGSQESPVPVLAVIGGISAAFLLYYAKRE